MKKTLLFVALAAISMSVAFAGTITVTQPAGGSFAMGAACPVHWTVSGVSGNVKIQLIQPGGALVGVLAASVGAGTSPYNWTVAAPAVAGQSYKIRVASVADAAVKGESAQFSVTGGGGPGPGPAGSITVLTPNAAGTSMCLTKSYNITWTATGITQNVKVTLIQNDTTIGAIKRDVPPGTSNFNWTVGNLEDGLVATTGIGYKVRVRTNDMAIDDYSDFPFEIKGSDACGGGGGPIDPGIWEKLKKYRRIPIKWPPDPDPCRCPEFDMSKIRELLGDPGIKFHVELRKNGQKFQELGRFGGLRKGGVALPNALRSKGMSMEDFSLFKNGGAKFSLAIIGENGVLLHQIEFEGAQGIQQLR